MAALSNAGVCIVTKNTFLDLVDMDFESDDTEVLSSLSGRTRCLSDSNFAYGEYGDSKMDVESRDDASVMSTAAPDSSDEDSEHDEMPVHSSLSSPPGVWTESRQDVERPAQPPVCVAAPICVAFVPVMPVAAVEQPVWQKSSRSARRRRARALNRWYRSMGQQNTEQEDESDHDATD